MLKSLAVLGLVTILPAGALCAQTEVSVALGVTGWTPLVHDYVVQSIDAKPSPGPTIALGIGHSIAPRYTAGVTVSYSSSALRGNYGTTSSDLGHVRTFTAMGTVGGHVSGALHWQAGAGFLHYFHDSQAGFLAGSGTTRLLMGGGLNFRRPMLAHWDLLATANYDFHRFSSPDLRSHGYTQSQGVQRIALLLGLARGAR